MSKIEEFKEFVKQNPSLINYVKEDKMTWQKFYEMYDIYGENNSAWDEYLKPEQASTNTLGVVDIISFIKNINLDKMQESINSIQRVLGVLEDLKSDNKTNTPSYKPRPLYKHFED